MGKGYLLDNIPHEPFDGDMTKCRMTPHEVLSAKVVQRVVWS